MVTKDGGCDAKTLYKNPSIAHHEIPLAFENVLEILVGRYVVATHQ
jgi:hypothetical protein